MIWRLPLREPLDLIDEVTSVIPLLTSDMNHEWQVVQLRRIPGREHSDSPTDGGQVRTCDLNGNRIRVIKIQSRPDQAVLIFPLNDLKRELKKTSRSSLVGFHLTVGDDRQIFARRNRIEVSGWFDLIGIKA